jgi:SET domain-containing protein
MKVRVFVGKSRIAGQGLFTLQNIKKDTRVIQYVGERINKAQSVKRLAQGNAYIFTFSNQYDIDGKVLGNAARYINHSCAPNCEVEITRRNIWIVAIRDILAGEELTLQRYLMKYLIKAPFSMHEIGPVITPLQVSHQPQDVLRLEDFERQHHCQ